MPENSVKMITHRDDQHHEQLFMRLNLFRKENMMVDLTIVVEGQEFGAHKIVMAACSNFFLQEGCGQPRVVLNNANVTVKGFLPLLEYAYTSVLNVPQSDVNDVFLASVHLHIQPVSDFLRKFTSMQSSPGPNMANSLQQLEMLRLVLGMSQGNGNGAFGSQDAQALLKDNIPQLLQILKMSNELNNQQGQQPNSAIVTPQESPVTVASNDSCCSPQKDVSTVSSQDGDEDETTKSSPGAKIDSGVSEGHQGDEENAEFDDNLNKNNNMGLMVPQSPNSSVSSNQANLSVIAMDTDPCIPTPGTVVGRTRTGKPLTQPDLPALPPTGQYMPVRRRTLPTSIPKPHVCQICGSRFTRYHNLKQHIKLHSGVKPFECDICGKRFTRNYTLRLHKAKHTGQQQFSCGSCAFTTSSPADIKAHYRMHQHQPGGARPFRNDDAPPSMVHSSPYQHQFDPSLTMNPLLATLTQNLLNSQRQAAQSAQAQLSAALLNNSTQSNPENIATINPGSPSGSEGSEHNLPQFENNSEDEEQSLQIDEHADVRMEDIKVEV